MLMYHKEGAPKDSLNKLYLEETDLSVGNIDLTKALSKLSNKVGSILIDQLYDYRAAYDD